MSMVRIIVHREKGPTGSKVAVRLGIIVPFYALCIAETQQPSWPDHYEGYCGQTAMVSDMADNGTRMAPD
jgi:hypothetical protein